MRTCVSNMMQANFTYSTHTNNMIYNNIKHDFLSAFYMFVTCTDKICVDIQIQMTRTHNNHLSSILSEKCIILNSIFIKAVKQVRLYINILYLLL